MDRRYLRVGFPLVLALVFTAGLTFATLELPNYVDGVLQRVIHTPGGDSHADAVARLKTELFMAHYHVRAIGYVGFFLLVALIVAGFSTKRTGLAALGAFGVMLPAFAQFAGVMFFLAGLGILNAIWLPVLDISYELQNWGLVIRAPNDLIRWILGFVGVHSPWPTIIFFTGAGILVFLLGVYAWLTARARGKGIVDFWVYRISRHPQYLGWILWTYGAFLLIQLLQYPRRSWGIGASLPWLLSTMVIIGVALMEELNMRKRHGEAYEAYRRSAPFLLPLPRPVERFFAAPLRILFKKEQPDRRREVATVVGLWMVLLMAVSAFFYAGGLRGTMVRLLPAEASAGGIRGLVAELESEENSRRQYQLALQLASFGEEAVAPLVGFLEGGDLNLRVVAAEALEVLRSPRSVPALCAALSDSAENVRYRSAIALNAIGAPEGEGALLVLLDDPENHVRMEALNGLAALGNEAVLETAQEFLLAEEHWNRSGALGALGTLGSSAALPLVEDCLFDENEGVRREAVIALLRIGSPEARQALEGALADEDFEVRLYAKEALKRLPVG